MNRKTFAACIVMAAFILAIVGCGSSPPPAPSLVDDFESYAIGALPSPWVVESGAPVVAVDASTASKTAFKDYGSVFCYHSGAATENSLVRIRVRENSYDYSFYGVFARRTDSDNYYQLVIDKYHARLFMGESINGWGYELGHYDLVGFDYGVYHELKLQVNGSRIIGYLDGVKRINATNTDITGAGYGGLVLLNGSVFFDDFEYYTL